MNSCAVFSFLQGNASRPCINNVRPMNAILLIAHAPLASALRHAALHVLPDAAESLAAVDVQAQDAPEAVFAAVCTALDALRPAYDEGVLLLVDLPGATPCNVAQRVLAGDERALRLLTGVNLPMLLRALCYRSEPLEGMTERAVAGGHLAMFALNEDRDD